MTTLDLLAGAAQFIKNAGLAPYMLAGLLVALAFMIYESLGHRR